MRILPAEYVIREFKGVTATAALLGRDKSAISRWRMPKHKGGTEGNIPRTLHLVILEKAKELGLDITPSDLIFGRLVREVEA